MALNFGPVTHPCDCDESLFQGNQPTCAIRSQEIVMRDFGIQIPQDELVEYATKMGWYKDGTPMNAVGNLLDACKISTHRMENASIYDLANELNAGHRVIVGVDANEIWRNQGIIGNWLADHIKDPNHALIVTSLKVDLEDPAKTTVLLTDPGSGEILECPYSRFAHSWKDADCFMVATDEAAPYQYNPDTQMMEYSNFATDYSIQEFPFHNEFQDVYSVVVCDGYEPYYVSGHIDALSDNLSYDDFLAAFETGNFDLIESRLEIDDFDVDDLYGCFSDHTCDVLSGVND